MGRQAFTLWLLLASCSAPNSFSDPYAELATCSFKANRDSATCRAPTIPGGLDWGTLARVKKTCVTLEKGFVECATYPSMLSRLNGQRIVIAGYPYGAGYGIPGWIVARPGLGFHLLAFPEETLAVDAPIPVSKHQDLLIAEGTLRLRSCTSLDDSSLYQLVDAQVRFAKRSDLQ